MARILAREALTPSTFLWELDAPDIAAAAQPGQFVMVHLHDGAERVPLTIADFDRQRGTVTLVVQALGKSTVEMRDRYREGDEVADVVGPLGQPQHIERVGHVVLVGGGLGVAPVLPQLRAFQQAGNRTTAIVGFRTAAVGFWQDRLAAWADRMVVCTDDGSAGRTGLVTEALADVLRDDPADLVVAIGPLVMMRACADVTRPLGVRTLVSINSIMVDGTGMCGSCRVSVGGEVRFACVDGPDFDAHAVDFAELLARQGRFRREEHEAVDDYQHVCDLERTLFVEGKRTYKKLRELEPTQVPMAQRDPVGRRQTFDEVNLGYSMDEARREAERCIQCTRPTCIAGCPVEVDIPRFIRHILVRDLDGALGVLHESNVLPSVCGRVCPQERQCEGQCVIGRKLEPVAIGRLERFVGDNASAVAAEPPASRSLGRVAVVGSGPAGLACAADLARDGAEVVVFEALQVPGGVLRYGIPAFRLPREVVAREVERLQAMGVEIRTNTVIGRTFTVHDLLGPQGFDAVFLGVGAGAPSFLNIRGEGAGHVLSANELLTRVNLMGGDRFPFHDTPVGLGNDVVVVGAGNTAMDCLRVAVRLGAERVRCVYRRSREEAPARAEELRHAEEEGVEFLFLHSPTEVLLGDDGDVRGLRVQRMRLGAPDDAGRRRPEPLDDFVDIDCDTVVEALGTNANPVVLRSTPGLGLDRRGYIAADPATQATNLPGVFAGGDIVTGGATVILAMGAGRRAARSIAGYLRTGKAWPPVTDVVVPDVRPHGTCPRCGRPVDDGDDGDDAVCCAGASITWRCEGCGKVSEGVAFPYGRCPACGGSLAIHATGRPDDDESLAAVRAALEIELGGRAFYRAAAAEVGDPALAELFGRFAAMEDEHLATLLRRYHVDLGGWQDSGDAVARTAQFTGALTRPDDPENLFRTALAFEHAAVALFDDRVAAAAGPAEGLYRELAAEEREHVDLLTTELQRWREGRRALL